MARVFVLPDLGEGLTEAEIVRVLVREGEVVGEDAPLVEVETDKAQVEIPSPMAGRVQAVHVRPGQTVKVGAPLVSFGAAPETAARPSPATGAPAAAATPATDRASVAPATDRAAAPPARAADDGPVPATPATRRLARELGVDLRAVRATGPGGRVSP